MKNINILGINLSLINKHNLLKQVNYYLDNEISRQIVTPNPEIILSAIKDEEYFYIINRAALALPDGFGLKIASWLMFKNLHRITGADFVIDLLKIAEIKNKKVLIVNWSLGLSTNSDIEKVLKEKFHHLEFKVLAKKRNDYDISDINYEPDIMISLLGFPYQDKYIYHVMPKFKKIRIGIGVGGAFDFLTGKIKRAPKTMRTLGFEWLWRLFQQPQRRAKRISNAIFRFAWKFFKWNYILPFIYRPNVACLLYKKDGDKYKILLVERKSQPGHWQLPQGGTDGEPVSVAGRRELEEELGTKNFKKISVHKNVHKYIFGELTSKFLVLAKLATGYKGQKQSLYIAKYLGDDKDIKINFWEHSQWKWVESDRLIETVHDVRKEAAKKYIKLFNNIKNL